MVPKNQLTQIPEYENVTGSDGRQYKVARSQLNSVQNTQQQPTNQFVPQQVGSTSSITQQCKVNSFSYFMIQLEQFLYKGVLLSI